MSQPFLDDLFGLAERRFFPAQFVGGGIVPLPSKRASYKFWILAAITVSNNFESPSRGKPKLQCDCQRKQRHHCEVGYAP